MMTDLSDSRALRGASWSGAARQDGEALRAFAIAAGLCWSVVFVVVGLRYELQMYGDGSMFSYAVAVQDAWAFHWHNISGRLFPFLFSSLPAEAYVALTRDARGGIALYGFLHFVTPLLGLLGTLAADRSKGRIIFGYACGSTACLCPLVFGFPTEVWMAHALFWPTLAVCHYARPGIGGFALVFAALLALLFTHAGAMIFAAAILSTLALRGGRDPAFLRAAGAFAAVMAISAFVRMAFPPDDYFAPVLLRAALHVFDITICTSRMFLLLSAVLAGYGAAFLLLLRVTPRAHLYAAAAVALALAVYWLEFVGVHTDKRYYMRTLLLVGTPVFGALAAWYALEAEGRIGLRLPLLPRLLTAFAGGMTARVMGAVALVMLVHAVETAKFVTAWTHYKAAVRALAAGTGSDPALGDPRFVSAARIDPFLNRLSWNSTTPYLSVLAAPGFAPARLVVDPKAGYFWLSCATAAANQEADRAIPVESRRLVRVYACRHR